MYALPPVQEAERDVERPGDALNLRLKLSRLANHPDLTLTMGRHARQGVEKNNAEAANYEAIMEIYRVTLDVRKTPGSRAAAAKSPLHNLGNL